MADEPQEGAYEPYDWEQIAESEPEPEPPRMTPEASQVLARIIAGFGVSPRKRSCGPGLERVVQERRQQPGLADAARAAGFEPRERGG